MYEISRRRMVMAGTSMTLLPLLRVTQGLAGTVDRRPNILFALADDWGWPHAPHYGDKS